MIDVNKYSEKERIQAAYALNLCAISVSQIVDYDDLIILDQEYDAILNNLNLENIPKDEALLNIIKQILDTITFFKIQDLQKQQIESDYQDNMRNAIWSAIPNFSFFIGSNPATIALSIASQVGMGYMNYRKQKANNEKEKRKSLFPLQIAALEQLNALRRELFVTAWRLADEYQFSDEYRLSEKQIHLYNKILMETDDLKRFERLKAIENYFQAFPPYWYYLGSAANKVCRLFDQAEYKEFAIKCFDHFCELNQLSILRSDILATSCCLEYIELLDPKTNKDKILELINTALKFSEESFEVQQVCGIYLLQIGEFEQAVKCFRNLVIEDYNTISNAQILSQLYVLNAIETQSNKHKLDYDTLCHYVDKRYCLMWPEDIVTAVKDDVISSFMAEQRQVLYLKYAKLIELIINKYTIELNKKLQTPIQEYEYCDEYYLDTIDAIKLRKNDFNIIFTDPFEGDKKGEYQNRLKEYNIGLEYIKSLTQIVKAIKRVTVFKDTSYNGLQVALENFNKNTEANFNSLTNKIRNCDNEFTITDVNELIDNFKLINFIKYQTEGMGSSYLEQLSENAWHYLISLNSLDGLVKADSEIRKLCNELCIQYPTLEYIENKEQKKELSTSFFNIEELLGEDAIKEQKELERDKQQFELFKAYSSLENKFIRKQKVMFALKGEHEFQAFFKEETDIPKLVYSLKEKGKILAILIDKSMFKHYDLFFTNSFIVLTTNKNVIGAFLYSEINFHSYEKQLEFPSINDTYKEKDIDVDTQKLMEELIKKLKLKENKTAKDDNIDVMEFILPNSENKSLSLKFGTDIGVAAGVATAFLIGGPIGAAIAFGGTKIAKKLVDASKNQNSISNDTDNDIVTEAPENDKKTCNNDNENFIDNIEILIHKNMNEETERQISNNLPKKDGTINYELNSIVDSGLNKIGSLFGSKK